MQPPCYICGADAEIENLCVDCYNKEHPIARINPVASIVICKKCGSVKIPGGWRTLQNLPKTDAAREEQIDLLLRRELEIYGTDVELTIVEVNKLDRVLNIELIVEGCSHPDIPPHSEVFPLEVRFNLATCDTCAMKSGGYYESTLQIRADDRFLTEEEKEQITKIARDRTIAEYGKDPKAFILQIDEIKFGLDLFIGSESLCKKISEEIEHRFLADRKENYKLIGQEKGGKDKFRITIVLRLPHFTQGDFVKIQNNLCQVISLGTGGLGCFDLVERITFTTTPKSAKWKKLEFIAGRDQSREYMVISNAYGQPLQIMDTETFLTMELELDRKIREQIETGSKIQTIEHDGQIYILPQTDKVDKTV